MRLSRAVRSIMALFELVGIYFVTESVVTPSGQVNPQWIDYLSADHFGVGARVVEPAHAGVCAGGAMAAFFIMEGFGFLDAMAQATLTTLMTEEVAWVMLVCGLYGGFIALLVKGGGSHALGRALMSRIDSKRGGLLATWSLGLAIFLDDYLNSLTVGATMKAVTDRFRTSRAMLAYVVDSTAAPLCLLVPLSSWGRTSPAC